MATARKTTARRAAPKATTKGRSSTTTRRRKARITARRLEGDPLKVARAGDVGRFPTHYVDGNLVHRPLDPKAVQVAAMRQLMSAISEGTTGAFELPPEAGRDFSKGIPAEYCYAAMVLRGEDPDSISFITGEGMLKTMARLVRLAMGATSPSWDRMYVHEKEE